MLPMAVKGSTSVVVANGKTKMLITSAKTNILNIWIFVC